jgi:hypothetical protein
MDDGTPAVIGGKSFHWVRCMDGNEEEIAEYLQLLLDHGRDCESEDCPTCQKLHGIFEVIQNRLFTSPVYPEVMAAAASTAPRVR